MKKICLLFLSFIAGSALIAQMSVMVGPTFLKPFGSTGIYPGFHIGMEFGQDDMQTYYGKLSFLPSKTFETNNSISAIVNDATLPLPYQLQLDVEEKFNYTVLEFGKRFYFGEGFDSGFSPYGGSSMQLVFNKVKWKVEDYDQNNYKLSDASQETVGSLFGLFFGIGGGVKKSFYFGTLYLDAGMSYSLLAVPSNNVASSTNNFKSLLFNFNIGFRKDFY